VYTLIIVGWVLGMAGYIALNKTDKYSNKHFYDVKKNIKKFKHIRDDVNGIKKDIFQ
jgi:hypothetical protein